MKMGWTTRKATAKTISVMLAGELGEVVEGPVELTLNPAAGGCPVRRRGW
jgi:hypothetical protein